MQKENDVNKLFYPCCNFPKEADRVYHIDYHKMNDLPMDYFEEEHYINSRSEEFTSERDFIKDRFCSMFLEQEDFQKKFYDKQNLDLKEKVALSKEYLLSAHRELNEVLDELPWKSHRKYVNKTVDKTNLTEEAVDVFKFLLNVLIIWDIYDEEFYNSFVNKSIKVRERHEKENN